MASVAAATAAIYGLKDLAPVVSLSVVYLPAEPRRDWVALEDVILAARDGASGADDHVRVAIDADVPPVRADAAHLERARIFEPFYRGPASTGEPWGGSGLGLAIAKGFVEANGGTITVDSLP